MASQCVTGCAGSITPAGTYEENINLMMAPVVNAGIPVVSFLDKKNIGIMRFMFDEEVVTAADGTKMFSYKLKEGFGGTDFQAVLTNSEGQLEWREHFNGVASTTVASAVTAANVIEVEDISKLKGIAAGSKIEVYTSGALVTRTVKSIDENEITLVTGTTITAAAGDCVFRGHYSRGKSCTAKVSNKYNLEGYNVKVANFADISISLEFTTNELSVDRFTNYLGQDGAMKFIAAYKSAAVEGFIEELQSAIWKGRNLKAGKDVDGNTVDGTDVNESMGIIEEIKRNQTALSKAFIVDLSTCCSGGGSNIDVVEGFFNIIREAHRSGAYDNNVVTLVCNNLFLENMQKLQSAFLDVTGMQPIYNVPSNGEYMVRQAYPMIQLGDIIVERMYDKYLDKYNEAIAVTVPLNKLFLAQKKYSAMTSDMQVTKEINYQIESGFPRLRFKDRTEYETNGLGDCFVYTSNFNFATALAGVESGAWRIIKGFAPCTASCTDCSNDELVAGNA